MAHLIAVGCVSIPEESSPESSEHSSPISRDGWPQPKNPEIYYAAMASAAASAYPARFEALTVQDPHGLSRLLKANELLRLDLEVSDSERVVWYQDTHLWERIQVVIAFRGTVHPTFLHPASNWTDVGVDLESQFVKVPHTNLLLGPDAPVIGTVGAGWRARWSLSLLANDLALLNALNATVEQATGNNRYVEVNVVGHSLGAVVAELAGLDIEEFFNARIPNGNYEVNVVAFNPPKLGSDDLVTEYRRRLRAKPNQFRISVFTREGDVVDDVPVDVVFGTGFYRQVIANLAYDNLTPLCSPYMFGTTDHPLGDGEAGEARKLPYAPRLHVTEPFTYGAHSIDDWVGNPQGNIRYRQVAPRFGINPGLNPKGFRCMFAPDTLGTLGQDHVGIPPEPKLNCSVYATETFPDDCNPSPPPPGGPSDEL